MSDTPHFSRFELANKSPEKTPPQDISDEIIDTIRCDLGIAVEPLQDDLILIPGAEDLYQQLHELQLLTAFAHMKEGESEEEALKRLNDPRDIFSDGEFDDIGQGQNDTKNVSQDASIFLEQPKDDDVES